MNPDNEKELIKITIAIPNITFNDEKLNEKYGKFISDKVNFVNDLKSFVLSYDKNVLK